MNDKLPKVFVNEDAQKIVVNQIDSCANKNQDISLDKIFDDKNRYLFLHKYRISFSDEIVESSIIYRNNKYIMTIDGDKINIDEINSIVEIKK